MTLNISDTQHNNTAIMLSVIMLSVIMLSVIMLSVIMQSCCECHCVYCRYADCLVARMEPTLRVESYKYSARVELNDSNSNKHSSF